MKKIFIIKTLGLLTLVCMLLASCKQAQKVADLIVEPTPREVYARQFENDSAVFARWENAFDRSFGDSIRIELPYSERGRFFAENILAYSYNLELKRGEVFHAEIRTDSFSQPVFIDLYEQSSDSLPTYDFVARGGKSPNASKNEFPKTLNNLIEKSGIYKLIVQPGIEVGSDFELVLYSTPSYTFPVAGKNNDAIQSFWGADRDAGRRSHKGVDIFADRGTPALAATEGRVSSTGERGLGGKQVWLRSGLLGNSLYYAHLDSIIAKTGQRVQSGDTLGLVGNTGNAKTTAPHLHFGIYEGYRGAIDPLPFIRINDTLVTDGIKADDQSSAAEAVSTKSPQIIVSATLANLRNSPSVQGQKVGEANRTDTLSILGLTGKWAHIKTKTGGKAYVHRSLIDLAPIQN